MTIKHLLKTLFAVVAICMLLPMTASAQSIEINANNFPDENFRNYLLEQSYGQDRVITEEEVNGITYINVDKKNISSLKGIEHFTALETLSCDNNQLTSLDVSQNPALEYLDYGNNQQTSLDVSQNPALTRLYCANNQLTSLDVSQNPALRVLYCNNNQLASLDVSQNPALVELSCSSNQLTSLDVSQNSVLASLSCNNNQLASLNVSQNSVLTSLVCGYNPLMSLDVSKNTALTNLVCHSNQLTNLNVSKNPLLETLGCEYNQLTCLDVSQNVALTGLGCSNNQLSSLDFTNNTALIALYCRDNQIKGEAMEALINSLPQNMTDEECSLYICSEAYNEGNVCTKRQVTAAKAKGWTPYCYIYNNGWAWKEYEGSDDYTDYDEIALSDTGMGTYCSSNDLDFTHVDGLKAYIASGYDRATGTVLLTRVTEVPAGTGIILMGSEGTHDVPYCSEPSQYYYVSLLKGTLAEQELPTEKDGYTNYILTKGDDGVMRFYQSSGGIIAAHKAYLQVPMSEAGSRSILGYTFDDDLSTAIKHPKHPARQQIDALYNLNGQRIGQPRKGIYIQGGKKVIIH